MVRLILITHGSLGKSLIQCAQHVIGGPLSNLDQIPIYSNEKPQTIFHKIEEALHGEKETEDGVILFTDIFGGTPSNIASRFIVPGQIEAISGVNLSMLVRALTYSNQPLSIVLEKALVGGHAGVLHMKAPAAL